MQMAALSCLRCSTGNAFDQFSPRHHTIHLLQERLLAGLASIQIQVKTGLFHKIKECQQTLTPAISAAGFCRASLRASRRRCTHSMPCWASVLGGNEVHVWPRSGFADGSRVVGIVFAACRFSLFNLSLLRFYLARNDADKMLDIKVDSASAQRFAAQAQAPHFWE